MDLYWILTPKPEDEKLNEFDEGFFCKMLDKDWSDRRELDGVEFKTSDLPELEGYVKVLEASNGSKETIKSIQKMIDGIKRNGSITIVYR